MGVDHCGDLARMRQHCFEAEALASLQTCGALEIGDQLRLSGALRLGQIEGLRDVVRIDVDAEIDPGVAQRPGELLTGVADPYA
jgi:hypothetical protein